MKVFLNRSLWRALEFSVLGLDLLGLHLKRFPADSAEHRSDKLPSRLDHWDSKIYRVHPMKGYQIQWMRLWEARAPVIVLRICP